MSGYGYKRKWLRASKALEYYVAGGPWADSWENAEWQLYMAVIDGECRCRHNFNEVEDPSVFSGQSFHPEKPHVLPFDLEVLLEDVDRIWNWESYDIADVIARRKLSVSQASIYSETTILNLNVLLNRLGARMNAMSLAEAESEISFDARWLAHERDLKLILGAGLLGAETLESRQNEFEEVVRRRNRMTNAACKPNLKRGRKPRYDWRAIKSHIFEMFEYHGPLSQDDPEWSCQADVEKAIKDFCFSQIGKEPSTTLARQQAKLFISEFMVTK